MATSLYSDPIGKQRYIDKRTMNESKMTLDEYFNRLRTSTWIYIGNLSFYTQSSQIYHIFSMYGAVEEVIMGINKKTKASCGFCFVRYSNRQEAEFAMDCLNFSMVDDRVIRLDWDVGFSEGRQYGRGYMGGQVRDEIKGTVDKDRDIMIGKKRYQESGEESYSKRKKYEGDSNSDEP
jgi:nuclear cap-binding protein subunit 2